MTREEAIKIIKSATVYTPKEIEALETLIPGFTQSEDDRILNALITHIRIYEGDFTTVGVTRLEMLDYLERLKERKSAEWNGATMNGEPIPTENHSVDIPLAEWSEEDKERIQRIRDFMWKNRKGDTDTIYQIEKDADWLISLLPQSKREYDNYCKENCKGYQETGKCFSDGPCAAKQEQCKDNEKWLH